MRNPFPTSNNPLRTARRGAGFTVAPLALTLLSLSACSSSGTCHPAEAEPDSLKAIYILQRGWHTGIAVASADWPDRSWPVLRDFAGADYLEFGWGDRRFYEAEKDTVWLGSRAALWPTDSAIHVIGLRAPLERNARVNGVVELHITADGLRKLAAGVEHEFAGKAPTATGASSAGAPRPNRFYYGAEKFYFPRMCNWWVAVRLREAGCPIHPASIITAPQMMREAQSLADQDPEFQAQRRSSFQPPTANR